MNKEDKAFQRILEIARNKVVVRGVIDGNLKNHMSLSLITQDGIEILGRLSTARTEAVRISIDGSLFPNLHDFTDSTKTFRNGIFAGGIREWSQPEQIVIVRTIGAEQLRVAPTHPVVISQLAFVGGFLFEQSQSALSRIPHWERVDQGLLAGRFRALVSELTKNLIATIGNP